jgi:membrane protein involved in colicin uptake
MSTTLLTQEKSKDKVVAYAITAVVHILLFILMIVSWNIQAPQGELYGDGIPLRLGNVELAGGNDQPVPDPGGNSFAENAVTAEQEAGEPEQPQKSQRDIATDDNGKVRLPDKDKKGAEGDAKKREREAREAEERRRKEELERELGGGPGEGTPTNNGNGQGPGQQGGPEGGLGERPGKGIGTLSGKIKDRGVPSNQVIKGNFNRAGTIVVRICIDRNGKVISAKNDINKSKITDRKMVQAAEKYASEMKFNPKEEALGDECGDVIVEFKFN